MAHAIGVSYDTMLRTLFTNDVATGSSLRSTYQVSIAESGLDPRSHVLVRLAALASTGAPAELYAWQAEMAEMYEVTQQEMLGVLVALKPTIGLARVATAAAELCRALGIEETGEAALPAE